MFGFLGSFFKSVGKVLGKALSLAAKVGLDDAVVALALKWVKVADQKYVSNPEKREWVVSILVQRGIPERIARIAVELALGLLKDELKKFEEQ
jgi:hypothetical protein